MDGFLRALLVALLLLPGIGRADIVLDNVTAPASFSAASATFSHTIGGDADRLLAVCVGVEAALGGPDVNSEPLAGKGGAAGESSHPVIGRHRG